MTEWQALEHSPLIVIVFQLREGEAPSYFNAIEAASLVDLVSGLLNQHQATPGRPGVAIEDIGVIATYRKQASTPYFHQHRRLCRMQIILS